MLWIGIHENNYRYITDSTELTWRIYADDAVPVEGQIQISSYGSVQRALHPLNLLHEHHHVAPFHLGLCRSLSKNG